MLITGPKDAKPLIIFQGGNCINPMTLSWFTSLFGEYRIYAPDSIGHPGYSAQTRISAKDDSFAMWVSELLDYYKLEKCAFIGPSYGGGIILRLAAFMPERIACAVLLVPSGLRLGSKLKMIHKILLPMFIYLLSSSRIHLQRIADTMSNHSMKEVDKHIIGEIFRYVRLEQDMPKLTNKQELQRYTSPTLVMAGTEDILFPAPKVVESAKRVITNVETVTYEMGHFPDQASLLKINTAIRQFLADHY